MRKDKRFLEFASKLWLFRHGRFKEMCALAVTGQLGGAQMCELDEHIAGCESCRKFLESIARVSVQVMPLLSESHAPAARILPPRGMRERFVARLASEAKGIDTGRASHTLVMPAVKEYPLAPEHEAPEADAEKKVSPLRALHSRALPVARRLAFATCCLIAALSGYYAGAHRSVQSRPQLAQGPSTPSTMPSAPEVTPVSSDLDRVKKIEQQDSALKTQVNDLKEELASAQREYQSLTRDLGNANEKSAAPATQNAIGATVTPSGNGQHGGDQISSLQAQIERLNQRLQESEASVGVQKQINDELSAKLEGTEAELQQERELKSAKTEIGDLMAARNLHIVDVYDADPNGKRQRSFGRVFYIEGKSLVFYAYDLDDSHQFKANVVFHVWGGKAGVKEVTHSLGILQKDSAGENRWAMSFDDPNVLAQINSVFVTAESANKGYDKPHGKKVLYAYFGGSANHP
jgi:hypothetical protein